MSQNKLFTKILMIFLLPALGTFLFTSLMVYEKVKVFDQINSMHTSLDYMKNVKELMHSLQKERSISSIYLLSKKFKYNLNNQRLESNINVEKIKEFFIKNNNITNSKEIKHQLEELYTLRNEIDRFSIKPYDAINKYIYINKLLLDSTISIKLQQATSLFNRTYLHLNNLLTIKEYAEIEITFMTMINEKKLDQLRIHHDLINAQAVQKIHLNEFLLRASVEDINKYKELIVNPYSTQLAFIREEFKIVSFEDVIYVKNWWEIFRSRTFNLNEMYDFSLIKAKEELLAYHEQSNNKQQLSFLFLFLSIAIMLFLLYLLKSITKKEEKSFNEVDTQHEVYKLLNKTNKILLKIKEEKVLFNGLCYMISKNKNMSFALICKGDKKIHANSSPLKDYVSKKINTPIIYNKSLIAKVFNSGEAIIIDTFEKTEASILAAVAKKYNLKSAAAFPIIKFGKVYAVLIIYSNKLSFFNNEIEILFNNMINDVSHTLEKIAYEEMRKKQEDELRIASYAFETNEPMLITNKESQIIKANQAFCNVLGYSLVELVNQTPNMFKSNFHDSDFFKNIWNDLSLHGSWSGELYNYNKKQELLALRSTITAIKDSKGEITHYLAQYLDISKEKEKEKALEFIATHDNLTRLPNRFLLMDRLKQALLKASRIKNYACILFIDLDNFKKTNDTMGHEIGDKLLILVANTLKRTLRKEDTVARIGGDEFIILAQNLSIDQKEAKAYAKMLANKIKDALNEIKTIDQHVNIVTPSIGITLFNNNERKANEIIKQADKAMYKAKNSGKNTCAFYDLFCDGKTA